MFLPCHPSPSPATSETKTPWRELLARSLMQAQGVQHPRLAFLSHPSENAAVGCGVQQAVRWRRLAAALGSNALNEQCWSLRRIKPAEGQQSEAKVPRAEERAVHGRYSVESRGPRPPLLSETCFVPPPRLWCTDQRLRSAASSSSCPH